MFLFYRRPHGQILRGWRIMCLWQNALQSVTPMVRPSCWSPPLSAPILASTPFWWKIWQDRRPSVQRSGSQVKLKFEKMAVFSIFFALISHLNCNYRWSEASWTGGAGAKRARHSHCDLGAFSWREAGWPPPLHGLQIGLHQTDVDHSGWETLQ